MEETKVKAIVLKSFDYKEKDKLVELFSLENGIITAKLTGCKNANAKLKFAFQPFCFAEFMLSKKGEFNSIISANLIESFFDLTKDYNNFEISCKMLEIVGKILKKGEINKPLFVLILKCLNLICYEKCNAKLILLKFLLETNRLSGYGINFEKCSECGNKFDTKKYLKNHSSEFVCTVCNDGDCVLVENGMFNALKIISNTNLEKFGSIKFNDALLEQCKTIILKNFESVFSILL